jgi:hypothetical protein
LAICRDHRAGVERGRNATGIWRDLVDNQGFAGGYQSVKRYVPRLRGGSFPEARVNNGAPPGWIGRQVDVRWHAIFVRLLDPRPAMLLRENLGQKRGSHRIRDADRPRLTPPYTHCLLARAHKAGASIGALCKVPQDAPTRFPLLFAQKITHETEANGLYPRDVLTSLRVAGLG